MIWCKVGFPGWTSLRSCWCGSAKFLVTNINKNFSLSTFSRSIYSRTWNGSFALFYGSNWRSSFHHLVCSKWVDSFKLEVFLFCPISRILNGSIWQNTFGNVELRNLLVRMVIDMKVEMWCRLSVGRLDVDYRGCDGD